MLETVEVRFEYRASTAVDEAVTAAHRGCAEIVGPTHIHPSWQDFRVVRLQAAGEDLWARTFFDVPVGSVKIRVSDANECDVDPLGAVTGPYIYANGTLLTKVVQTPGDGTPEPGFLLTVLEDSQVLP
jgi:hypothetical protein